MKKGLAGFAFHFDPTAVTAIWAYSGFNSMPMISSFANICLKALRDIPEAATPERVNGLRKMVQSFGSRKVGGGRLENKETFVDLRDEIKFIHFIFEEYLKALDLYLNGKGHHGFAGHLLTVGHALIEGVDWFGFLRSILAAVTVARHGSLQVRQEHEVADSKARQQHPLSRRSPPGETLAGTAS